MSKEQAELRRWLEEVTDPELSAELLSIRNEERRCMSAFTGRWNLAPAGCGASWAPAPTV